jgi:hypothetical protein
MYESELVEYTNRNKMEETSGKVFARLHQMKSILCKTIKSNYHRIISLNFQIRYCFRNTSILWRYKSSKWIVLFAEKLLRGF